MAARVATLVNNLGPLEQDVCMTGGVAKNAGVVASLERLLSTRLKTIKRLDPQLAGALGAALFAAEGAEGGAPC
jgi:activator of 2-hydroxyglutaryl-CoA dehydratase